MSHPLDDAELRLLWDVWLEKIYAQVIAEEKADEAEKAARRLERKADDAEKEAEWASDEFHERLTVLFEHACEERGSR